MTRLKWFIVIQWIATIIWAISHLQTAMAYADMDWVTGTLGEYQCNVLMCLSSCIGIAFLCHFYYFKNKQDLLWALSSFSLAVLTGSVIYTFVLLIATILVALFDKALSVKVRLITFLIITLMIIIFVSCVPEWIVNDIIKLTDINYFLNRVVKLKYYYNTFIEYPKNESFLHFLIGMGPGEYTSRAADTCAGGYIPIYDRFFQSYQNPLRLTYISYISNQYIGQGLASTPQSSIISMTGEFGFVGLLFLFGFFAKKFISANPFSRMVLLFFFGLLFFDNALEFAKYVFIFWIVYYICTSIKCSYKIKNQHIDLSNTIADDKVMFLSTNIHN